MQLFSVWDEKMQQFTAPFMAVAPGQAARMFGDLVLEQGHPFQKHPDDYKLFRVGVMDELTGELKTISPPELVTSGGAFVPVDPAARLPLRSAERRS